MQCDHRRQQDDFSSVIDNFTSSSSTLESELSKPFRDVVELVANRIALPSDVSSGSYLDFPIVSNRYSIASSVSTMKCIIAATHAL